jgi:hypothetical protein
MAIIGQYHVGAQAVQTIDHQGLHQAIGQLDTYMDTNAHTSENILPKPLKIKRAPVAQADRARDS